MSSRLLVLVISVLPTVATAACPITGATYSTPSGARAEFRSVGSIGWMSDLAIGVRSGTNRPTHWFLFDRGSARYINLISTTDVTRAGWRPPSADGGVRPLGETHFVAASRDLVVSEEVPTSHTAVPYYLFFPDLPELLAHSPIPPEDMTQAIFKLARCGHR
jgi:hypothetical protein